MRKRELFPLIGQVSVKDQDFDAIQYAIVSGDEPARWPKTEPFRRDGWRRNAMFIINGSGTYNLTVTKTSVLLDGDNSVMNWRITRAGAG